MILVANRDEFYKRPSQPAHFWRDHPDLFGGRDLQGLGTWLAINRNGRFAALTNVRDPHNMNPQAKSRGLLVSGFLQGHLSARKYAEIISETSAQYNGFNLLLCDGKQLVYCNNRNDAIQTLEPGVFALSNASLDTPWPKTQLAKDKLIDWQLQPQGISGLANLLIDKQTAADHLLPATGISYEWEKALSAQFIEMEKYGTRTTTALMIDQLGNASFYERSFFPESGSTLQHFPGFWPVTETEH